MKTIGSTTSNNSNSQLPLVALIGPTNAGKSTLFNRFTGSRQAITAKEISTTRDRVFGSVVWQNKQFTLVDTGGLAEDESAMYASIHTQMQKAVEEADLLLFLYDGAEGLSTQAKLYLDKLRGKKTVWLVANKVDTADKLRRVDRLGQLGLPYYEISAATGRGVGDLLDEVMQALPDFKNVDYPLPVIALVGRPNVGKSSLLNALVEEERAVVSPIAGTTRDIVTEKLTVNGKDYLLADTAGVRRRGQIDQGAEAFSVKRSLQAIEQASAVIAVLDASQGSTRGDLHLLFFAKEQGKPTLLLFNKADLVSAQDRIRFHPFLKVFPYALVSALQKENLEAITNWIDELELNEVPRPS